MTKKSVAPSIEETAFDCPHCGAYTTQNWFTIYADKVPQYLKTPSLPEDKEYNKIVIENKLEGEALKSALTFIKNLEKGVAAIENSNRTVASIHFTENIFLSQCYHCHKIAIWVHKNIIYPPSKVGAPPNPDLPEDIIYDFEEARSILNLSPRGAAALLRLCIQKLCKSLGEKGKNIDNDITSLVSKGLDPLIQKSLDIVRVVGNEAVHPGIMDLKDDRDTALKLFDLVNIIANTMITIPRHTKQLYDSLPPSKLKQIEDRNIKANSKKE